MTDVQSADYQRGQRLGPADVECSCWKCGINYTVPRALYDMRRIDHQSIYCPLGHSAAWKEGKSKVALLEERLRRAEADAVHQRDQRDAAERSNASLRGVITKQKKRAANGVCPCCHRTFKNMADHMATKHPGFVGESR